MDSDAAEATGNLERGDRGATATTDIAGAEQKTRTGCQYTQISTTHVEPASEEVEETSRECDSTWIATAHGAHYPDLDEEELLDESDDSFTKLLAELSLEIEEEAEVELERGSGLADCRMRKADLSKTLEDSDLASHVKCCEEMAGVLPDVRTDHPTSMLGKEEKFCTAT